MITVTVTVITITVMVTVTVTVIIIIEETQMRMLQLIDGSGEKTFRKSRDVSLFAKLIVLTFLEPRLLLTKSKFLLIPYNESNLRKNYI